MSKLDLTKVTSGRGAKIEVHFQDSSDEAVLLQNYTQLAFLARIRNDVEQLRIDNGKDTIHMLISNTGMVLFLDQRQYDRWSKNPVWPNQSIRVKVMAVKVPNSQPNRFKGPSLLEYARFRFNQIAIELNNREFENCQICLMRGCPTRNANFSAEALAAAVDKIKAEAAKR